MGFTQKAFPKFKKKAVEYKFNTLSAKRHCCIYPSHFHSLAKPEPEKVHIYLNFIFGLKIGIDIKLKALKGHFTCYYRSQS